MASNTPIGNQFYLYRHIRLDTGIPFYVGIGTKHYNHHQTVKSEYRRAHIKSNRNIYWKRIANKAGYGVEIMYESDSLTEIVDKEKEFISLYGRKDNGTGILCNGTDGGDGNTGIVFTKEYRNKISIANSGRKFTDEHKRKIGEAHKGKVASKETRQRLSAAKKGFQSQLGRKRSDESKLKMSLAWEKRGPVSEETKKRQSLSRMGNKNALGMKHSEETKRKLSIRSKGVKPSIETIKRQSEARKKWWSNKKKNHGQ